MSRLLFPRPVSPRLGNPWRAGVRVALSVSVTLGLGLMAGAARAVEFAVVAAGDPIYRQLRALEPGKAQAQASLTRYEAALQTARVITRVANDPRADLSRAGWRSLSDLTTALQTELRQLGIDIEATRALIARNLKSSTPETSPSRNSPAGVKLDSPPLNVLGASDDASPARGVTANGSSLLRPGITSPDIQMTALSASIMPRLRVGAALMALQRAESDPFRSSGAGQALLSSSNGRLLGSDTSVDYDVNSWLSVRAQSSQRSLLVPSATPFLDNAFFDGATKTNSAGGGLGIEVGQLNFTAEIKRLSTDAGARGTSVGGGIGLSAWQNRLSLSAHLARLQPEDRSALDLTQTELNIGLDVTKRLNLSLFYQGLFSQRNEGSSRVAGGLNLSF